MGGVEASGSAAGDRRPQPLAKGRKSLSRAEVDDIQRRRIAAAVIDVCAVGGFGMLSVESITTTAQLSRRTFYDLFPNKDEAFLFTFDRACTELEQRVTAAHRAAAPDPVSRAIATMTLLTTTMAREPTVTHMCLVEAMGAGNATLARRERLLERFTALIASAGDAGEGVGPPAMMARTIVGGIYDVIHATALKGDLHRLPAVAPDFVYAILLPYLGADVARDARGTARAAIEQSEA